MELSMILAGLPWATRCFSLCLFINAKTNVRTLIWISQGLGKRGNDEPAKNTARYEDSKHRGNTRMVLWRLVRIEQEWPDNVAHCKTSIDQRDGEGFLGMPWNSTQYGGLADQGMDIPPLFAATQA
jgi:hypothetical protein